MAPLLTPQFTVTPINPQAEPEENTIINPGVNQTPLAPDVARTRAFKAKTGMGDVLPQSEEEVRVNMENGQDDALRQEASAKKSLQDEINKQQLIRNIISRNPDKQITPEDINYITDTYNRATSSNDPDSIFEEAFSKYYIGQADRTRANQPGTVFDDVATQTPKIYDRLKQTGDIVLAKREFALKMAQNAEHAVQQQTWVGWGLDQLKTAVPLYTSAKLRGWMKDTPIIMSDSGFGVGANLYDQTRELLHLPLPEYKRQFTTIMNKLINDNPSMAVTWARAVTGMSTSEENLLSAFELFDIAILSPMAAKLGKSALTKVKMISEAKDAMKDIVKSAEGEETSKVKMAQGAGDALEAGVQKHTEVMQDLMKGQPKPTKEALDALPSYLKQDAEQLRSNPGHLGQEIANRLAERNLNAADELMETLINRTTVDKVNGAVTTEDGLKAIYKEIQDDFRGVKNSILNIRITGVEPISGSTLYEIDLGRSRGVLFAKPLEARNFARLNGIQGYDLVRQGGGYKLTLTNTLNETSHGVRDNLLKTDLAKAPKGFLDAFMVHRIRSPQDTMSALERANRELASYAPASIMKIVQVEAEDIAKFARSALPGTTKKQKFEDWRRIVEAATDKVDADGNRGVFYNHIGELDHAYSNLIGRLPDEEEAAAYFAFKRIVAMDHILRTIRLYANKARLGVQQHRFSILDANGNREWSPSFEARFKNELPGGNDTVLIVGRTHEDTIIRTADNIPSPIKVQLEKELARGERKGLEIYSVENRPLAEFGKVDAEHRIRYVFTYTDEASPLSWNQLPRRGGGHLGFEFEHKIVQPNIRVERIGAQTKFWYEGDTPVAGVQIRAMGQDAAEKMNAVRQYFHKGDEAGAKAYWEQHFPMGISWDELKGWFEPTYLNGKKVPARLRTDIPFKVVSKNTKSTDVDKSVAELFPKDSFFDGTKRGSLERNYQVEFSQKRDNEFFPELINKGTAEQPLYSFEPAAKVDPTVMMNRAMSRITQATWLEDYKHMAIEHWIEDARPLLKEDTQSLRAAPFAHFEAATDKSAFKPDADPIQVQRLLTRRAQVKQFLGVKDAITTTLDRAGQNALDIAYEAKAIGKVAYVPAYLLSRIKDPFTFIRQVVFEKTMGLFNWTQVFNQLQSFVSIFGIAGPSKAAPGSLATLMHEWSLWSRNPNILKALDDKISSFKLPGMTQWKPGQFTESIKAMESTGFNHIGGEVALVDNRLNEKVIRGNISNFLEAGRVFFQWPEAKIRMGAWHTSYLEFRQTKPFGRLTNQDRLTILRRADDLYQNMSSASVSRLQTGIASVPTQFFTYQIRAAELFIGKRLTPKEKARLFATLGTVYGIPSAMGVSGFPFSEFINKNAQEGDLPGQGGKPYVPGDNMAFTTAMEGLASVVGALITGGGDPKSGTYYKISEKGIEGMSILKDVIRGDKGYLQLLGGATGTSIANIAEHSSGFLSATLSAIRGDGKFPIKQDDFIDIFREISSFDKAYKLKVALQTSKWFSRQGNYLGDVTKSEALIMTALGLNKEDLASANLQNWSLKDQRKQLQEGYKKFSKEYKRGMMALQDNDPEGSVEYLKRARNYLIAYGYDELTMYDAYARAARENGSMLDRTNFDFFIKKAPLKNTNSRMDAFQERKRNNILINGQ